MVATLYTKSNTLSGGSLGSCVDMKRSSQLRVLMSLQNTLNIDILNAHGGIGSIGPRVSRVEFAKADVTRKGTRIVRLSLSRGKRVVPQKSARGIQRGARPGAAAGRDPSDPPAASHWASPRALSMGRALRSVSRRRLAPLLRVARPSGRASGGGGELLGDRGTAVRFEAARPRGGVRLGGLGNRARRPLFCVGSGSPGEHGVSGESVGLPPDPS
ncbi:hypothetical protein BgiBS90_038137 [Biomphalaria glabrata]|nr:hypothetical protein BgiBS90_038137 [Biomphalaria glabrata]